MADATAGELSVPGARLYYETTGSGPILLVIQGGAGGAEGAAGLADELSDRFTVVSYDRRGFVRSPATDAAGPLGAIGQHSDDAHHLLLALTAEPAFVFGSSVGALIGLDLVARHPDQVRLLVAHEPPIPEVLRRDERDAAVAAQKAVEETYEREGLLAAMRAFAAVAGLDMADREPDVEVPRPEARRMADTSYFLTHDAPAVRTYRLNPKALGDARDRIVVAAGSTSGDAWPHHCAQALATLLGVPFIESPGGHNGYVMRPKTFAAWLEGLLQA